MGIMVLFLLMVYLGTKDERRLLVEICISDVTRCNYFAQVAKRYGNYKYTSYLDPKDRVTSYCVPKLVDSERTVIY